MLSCPNRTCTFTTPQRYLFYSYQNNISLYYIIVAAISVFFKTVYYNILLSFVGFDFERFGAALQRP